MERMVDQYKKMNIEEDVEDAEELEIVVVGLQRIFQDERLMIRPPLEPPPRMMLEVWIQLFHHLILFNSNLPFGFGFVPLLNHHRGLSYSAVFLWIWIWMWVMI
ncbi:unnamed protein product [Cuscuta epithymum]|uniref:Uncharacterized protein n=1 Tax=Cuscuta epithymum TaxID=186058 RepID=A0AAV0FIY8_9ASTE|nr:unnamed protein product [Cuscuta epithymum]